MVLTEKETGLLKDLRAQEQLCIKKYTRYAEEAKAPALRALFEDMRSTEEEHLRTVREMLRGETPTAPATPLKGNNHYAEMGAVYDSEEDKKHDAFLCEDMLTTEKHASSLYDTSVFEFRSPVMRKMLNHIQAEEQQHGEEIYAFVSANHLCNEG